MRRGKMHKATNAETPLKKRVSAFAVKMRLGDFLKIVEMPKLVISNICKMALGSNIRFRVIDGLQ